ncbi:hypothetical protein GPECTOR_35g854 [Gonium pectorale]|uniref:Uncharacterized protein n=1 Tax=Gonium pectorale TaxID=33097 RepID=A0A150GC38_GONPE|nr:hypothetical protein GPECTOR_35g854 [Gonium pectorale]|eukprot:KXZ47416.1 hypothetical protein GPECTOR_35g854 [Gonium pectorale]
MQEILFTPGSSPGFFGVGKAVRAAMAPLFPPFVAARLQVVLRCGGEARPELQACLEAVAETATTWHGGDASKARHMLLQDALLVLIQRFDHFAYGAGEEAGYGSEQNAGSELSRWSLEERARAGYQPRSLTANGGKAAPSRRNHRSSDHSATASDGGQAAASAATRTPGPQPQPQTPQLGAEAQSQPQNQSQNAAAGDEMVVVTLLLVTSGRRVLPRQGRGGGGVRGLASAEEVREALLELGRLRQEEVLRAELVWAPRAPGESLSWRQLQLSYPNLMPFQVRRTAD